MSPTPAERGARYAPVGRRTSTRLAQRSQPSQYRNLDDSSDDEVLSPMKLSAITKALLGGGHVSDASSTNAPAPTARRSSIPTPSRSSNGDQGYLRKRTQEPDNAPTSKPPTSASRPQSRNASRRSSIPALGQTASRDQGSPVQGARATRQSRRESNLSPKQASPVGSRDNSPAPRKRVVRLNAPPSANGANGSRRNSLRNSFSSSTRAKRPDSAEGHRTKTASSPVVQQDRSAKTPVLPVRTVRIAVGSSGQKPASGSSSDTRPKYSTQYAEVEGRNAAGAPAAPSAAVAPQASLRVKRVGKTPGSFLSGPARRGRRRQSEEDGDGQFEADGFGLGQDIGSQQAESRQQEEAPVPAASDYADFAASGSPVSARDSARDSARAALRRHKSTSLRVSNPPPSASSHRGSNAVAPTNPGAVESHQKAFVAPNNHILTARSHNVAQRPAPPPPPKMSVVETATAAAGASTAVQSNKKRQFLLRVNGKTYTRIDSLGRGGSGKVYRVSAENGKLLALKRVSLENLDDRTIKGYHGEIDLLQRLTGVNRVAQLIDHEFNAEKKNAQPGVGGWPKHFKLGKASDIWSLGCILYQMVYGQCPFAKIVNMMARVNAIKDWAHPIEFPEHTEHGVRVPPSLVRTLKRCLSRDQTQRPSCEELLSPTDPFLYPMELSNDIFAAADHGKVIPITPELLRDVVWDVAQRVRRGDAVDNEVLQLWPTAYWASCKKSLAMRNGLSGVTPAAGDQQ
ncbi:hypothetical protein CHGG_05861 [Chaetomium globosum CBS 148.51]|uniref:Protein kinase domain-containing protein n=1 Tax=Chaetomium globosum (strain ATCC 6205 / CBS 148.51 / DSM 1962 / NBRC 6347 / NRRL 1970) TaxID=306901 RepID=Q2H654_CHAGB|nr:uncharacterized protein CHGG_05861 [Chaetomium globosum CBS 148.51]EAQ89242.1 hypothetical protein CHGG_05861 [Chaetomium globosum CBS 148.51]